MLKKCHSCKYHKTYADKKDTTNRLFTMVCTMDDPNMVIDIHEGKINKQEWESLECCKGLKE